MDASNDTKQMRFTDELIIYAQIHLKRVSLGTFSDLESRITSVQKLFWVKKSQNYQLERPERLVDNCLAN